MKTKTNKLKKLERNRTSILTDDMECCYICKDFMSDVHEIYGGCNRQTSMKYGFTVPLCRTCHRFITDNPKMSETLKKNCQKAFEKEHTREDFLKIIGRSYL